MANATADQIAEPVGGGGRNFDLPVDGGTTLFRGVMISELTATGMTVPTTTALSGRVVGVSNHGIDNSAGADAAERVLVHADRVFAFSNGTGADAVSEATLFGSPLYASDDTTVNDNSAGDTRPFAGFFVGMEPDGKVRTYIPHWDASGGIVEAGAAFDKAAIKCRGASTANIANLASFTVAAVDGLTYIEGQKIFLKNQTNTEENGSYVVGVVAAGTAPLTRSLDADGLDELVPNAKFIVSEGTAHDNTAWQITTDTIPFVIDTTTLTIAEIPYGFGLVGAMVAEAIGSTASLGTSNKVAPIDHRHAMPASAIVGDTGQANVQGSAGTFAQSDHVHAEHSRQVTGVMTTDVPDLGAFVVTQDGVTYIEGELVLLANQTTPAEAGVYVVGAVSGTAPLTRVAWLPAAAIVRGGYTVYSEEGTLFASTAWFIAEAGAITIGTTAHTWYPEKATFSLAIPPGTGTITWADIPILSATKTQFMFTNAAEVTADLTVRYGLSAAATPGVVGTATATMLAQVAAGTVNVDDDSTMIVSVINR